MKFSTTFVLTIVASLLLSASHTVLAVDTVNTESVTRATFEPDYSSHNDKKCCFNKATKKVFLHPISSKCPGKSKKTQHCCCTAESCPIVGGKEFKCPNEVQDDE